MGSRDTAHEIEFQFPWLSTIERDRHERKQDNALTAKLRTSLMREQALQTEINNLMRRQGEQAKEFEHRLLNNLQLIASVLSLQSRIASPDAAAQLTNAATRIAAFGRVHHQLHLLDYQNLVEFKQYLQGLCEDIAGLLFHEQADRAIIVQGVNAEIPTAFGIPLGFIVNELITNAAKYTKGNIIIRFEAMSPANYSLSVLDEGPGLPAGFNPESSKGLGMKIVHSFVKQIGGKLHILAGDNDRGAHFTVTFCAPRSGKNGIFQ